MKLRVLLAALVLTSCVASVAYARTMQDMNVAVLRTIDKISARTRTFEVPIDKTVKFGNSLFIRLRACRKSSPLDQPESAAFLQIWEKKETDYKSKWIFSGWMFASNPSLSAMDHPVYDVWVIDCKNEATLAKSQEFSSEKAPEGAPAKGELAPTAETPPTPTAAPAAAPAPLAVPAPVPAPAAVVPAPAAAAPAAEVPAVAAPAEAKPESEDDPDAGSDDH